MILYKNTLVNMLSHDLLMRTTHFRLPNTPHFAAVAFDRMLTACEDQAGSSTADHFRFAGTFGLSRPSLGRVP